MMGSWLRPGRVLSAAEETRLVAAIRRAEEANRGEVLVHVERRCPGGDALARAAKLFEKLGMRRTATDTGVLLYVAVKDHKAAVFAGQLAPRTVNGRQQLHDDRRADVRHDAERTNRAMFQRAAREHAVHAEHGTAAIAERLKSSMTQFSL